MGDDDDKFPTGQRVVLGHRGATSMVRFQWSGDEPAGLTDIEWAEELGARWEGDELVIYDWPGFAGLLGYYEKGDVLIDND